MTTNYVVQRRYRTEIMEKVGGALDRIFEHIDGKSLHVCEAVTLLKAEKPIPKKKQDKLCTMLLEKVREEGDTETLSFEVVPWNESILRGQKHNG